MFRGGAVTRASDRERDAVVQRVQDAFAEGRLDDAEFDERSRAERSRAALTARTHADLDALLADLPAPSRSPPARPIVPPCAGRPEGGCWNGAASWHDGAVTWIAPEVERPEGPLTGPERPMLQAFLDWQRATLLYKCAGLTGEQLARRAIPPSELSLLGLLRHMTKVERIWFRMRFAGEQVDFPFGSDFQAEFEQADPARAAADYARLTEEIKHADAAAANASLDDTFTSNGEVMSLRMIYLHMIEEYARHLGHADLLREQIDGATGE